MTIRKATHDDIPQLLVMGEQFARYAPFDVGFSPEGTAAFLDVIMDTGLVLVAEQDETLVGVIVGALSPIWYSPGSLIASELAWWVDPQHRGSRAALQLVKAFEAWAIDSGAKLITLSDLRIGEDYPAGPLFERLGYRVSERAHTKEI